MTCRDWFQLSLKEGLTVFRDQVSSDTGSRTVVIINNVKFLRAVQFAQKMPVRDGTPDSPGKSH